MNVLCSCRAVSALVEIEVEMEGGRKGGSEGGREGGVSWEDEPSEGAPRAQRRVQDAHCTAKWSQLGMAGRCGTHHRTNLKSERHPAR